MVLAALEVEMALRRLHVMNTIWLFTFEAIAEVEIRALFQY